VNEELIKRQPDSVGQHQIKLEITALDKLRVSLYRKGIIVRDTTFAGKMRNGMFIIKNKYLKCHGVPYIFGGCNNTKRRIGLLKTNNLIINEAIDNSGALLLIIGAGYKLNTAYEFERIN
jgi:hypothetical protein